MVFYRKYRPQKISELDSEKVRQSLTTILASKEIPHAFLLTGPKGLGKTSAARIVAKIVNCEERKSISARGGPAFGWEPCDRCTQCLSIIQGTNLDVLEIDAASNRGIDEIRDLREKVKLAPAAATKKVYIIDEVHMLTTEAFNALLKILEEPPDHVMFILCTTEMHKVPETIRSRCFHVGYSRATLPELDRSLKRIVGAEHIKIDEEAVREIAEAGEGSFRDASKLLELAALKRGRKKITREMVQDLIGNSIQSGEFIVYIQEKNVQGALRWFNEAIQKGLNVKFWLEGLLEGLHSNLLRKYDVQDRRGEEFEGFTQEELKRLILLFSRAHQEMRTTVIPQLPAELAIIEYCIQDKSEARSTKLETNSNDQNPNN